MSRITAAGHLIFILGLGVGCQQENTDVSLTKSASDEEPMFLYQQDFDDQGPWQLNVESGDESSASVATSTIADGMLTLHTMHDEQDSACTRASGSVSLNVANENHDHLTVKSYFMAIAASGSGQGMLTATFGDADPIMIPLHSGSVPSFNELTIPVSEDQMNFTLLQLKYEVEACEGDDAASNIQLDRVEIY